MEFSELQNWGYLGMATVIGMLIVTLQKIFKNFNKGRDEQVATILQAAKEADKKVKDDLEAQIKELGTKVNNLEASVNKDMAHLKESYSSEIKNLGEKIEVLRDELNQRHSSLIELLTKIISNKK
jgi:peptidoglycan hydrolase CwlO-like protein